MNERTNSFSLLHTHTHPKHVILCFKNLWGQESFSDQCYEVSPTQAIHTRADERACFLCEGHLAGASLTSDRKQQVLTCEVIELWQSIQNDADQGQVEGGDFDFDFWFETPWIQVVRTQEAVDGTHSFSLYSADSVDTTARNRAMVREAMCP